MVLLYFMKQILGCLIAREIVQTSQVMSGASLSDFPEKGEAHPVKILFAN